MRIQLWSYNYAPEPTGIGPVSTVWAEGLSEAGHDVEVVAAHPHYPSPDWGTRALPYRERRNGIPVLRLPLLIGRETAAQRIRQELSFMLAQSAGVPFLGRPDVLVSVSPSFPALLPALVATRLRRVPWVLWLHDLLPDGAAATGLVDEAGPIVRASRWLERASYRAADRIAVLSGPFLDNLLAKGVPREKLELIYDPATRTPPAAPIRRGAGDAPRILSMGNIGHTQGLAPLVATFDRSEAMSAMGARLVITGDGVAAAEVRQAEVNGNVDMLGVVSGERLEEELRSATLALVSQSYDGTEFNLPSKLMNFMAWELPIVAAVNPRSEVARIVNEAGAGWVVDSSRPEEFPRVVATALDDRSALEARAKAAASYARDRFSREGFIARFEKLLREAVAAARPQAGILGSAPSQR